jgi:hypothetical protein
MSQTSKEKWLFVGLLAFFLAIALGLTLVVGGASPYLYLLISMAWTFTALCAWKLGRLMGE